MAHGAHRSPVDSGRRSVFRVSADAPPPHSYSGTFWSPSEGPHVPEHAPRPRPARPPRLLSAPPICIFQTFHRKGVLSDFLVISSIAVFFLSIQFDPARSLPGSAPSAGRPARPPPLTRISLKLPLPRAHAASAVCCCFPISNAWDLVRPGRQTSWVPAEMRAWRRVQQLRAFPGRLA